MKKILVIDDEEFIREMLVEYISDIGDYKVFTAGDGNTSFDLLEKENIDFIILDYTLPDITGEEFLARLKEKGIKTKVILTSGLESNFITEDDYTDLLVKTLKKPFDLNILDKIFEES